MNPWYFMVAVAALFALAMLYGFARSVPDEAAALRARFLALTRMQKDEARVHLADRLESLSLRFPGRSYVWYLRWLVSDLEKSKR